MLAEERSVQPEGCTWRTTTTKECPYILALRAAARKFV